MLTVNNTLKTNKKPILSVIVQLNSAHSTKEEKRKRNKNKPFTRNKQNIRAQANNLRKMHNDNFKHLTRLVIESHDWP